MNPKNCKKCGQFANSAHFCKPARNSLPKTAPKPAPRLPNSILSSGELKQNEIIASVRLMNTALGDPIEGGRSHFAQKQARITLEQRFGKIDWSK